ncbi:sel1 repeat family protein [Vibrio lentus]|uniref:sel1 repeat family protein n=1 Tax=Vibrio lentus TaxID=136468 RepID=UPI00178C96FB|nr:sel1 repeat family protein [Vibrio lentus]MDN3628435.1 sel1 repeat family protein [Vibrio lentus]
MFDLFKSASELYEKALAYKANNESKYLSYLEKSSDKGYAKATVELGLYYSNQDLGKAMAYFEKASCAGVAMGFHNMGVVHALNGNVDAAKHCYQKSAELNAAISHKELAVIYANEQNDLYSLAHAIYAIAYGNSNDDWLPGLKKSVEKIKTAFAHSDLFYSAQGLAIRFAAHEFNELIGELRLDLQQPGMAEKIISEVSHQTLLGESRFSLKTAAFLRKQQPIASRFDISVLDVYFSCAALTGLLQNPET